MDKDFLSDLNEVQETPKEEVKKTTPKTSGDLYVIKNVSKYDIQVDWDKDLMPEDLQDEFDAYLNKMYKDYDLSEINAKLKIVAIFIGGRSINFLHQFMTSKNIPVMLPVQEGKELIYKSQFVIPRDYQILCTEKQINSIKKFERRRITTSTGAFSDWYGSVAIKRIDPKDADKVNYSYVTTEGIKACKFSGSDLSIQPGKVSVVSEDASDMIKL